MASGKASGKWTGNGLKLRWMVSYLKIEMREKRKKKISFWKRENEKRVKARPNKSCSQTNKGV